MFLVLQTFVSLAIRSNYPGDTLGVFPNSIPQEWILNPTPAWNFVWVPADYSGF